MTGLPEDIRLRRTLDILSLSMMAAILLPLVHNLVSGWVEEALCLGGEELCLIAALWFNRRGQTDWAARIITFSILPCAALLVCLSGKGFQDEAMLMFPGILVLGALLLDWRVYLGFASVLVLTASGIGIADVYRLLPTGAKYHVTYHSVIDAFLALTLTAVAVGFLAASLKDSLSKSRRSAAALGESERNFRAIVEAAPDPIFIAGGEGQFLEVNEEACRQLGYSREQLLRLRIFDIVPPRFADRVRSRLREMKDVGGFYDSSHIRADGTEIPVELKVSRIVFAGRPALLGIARDVTERRQAEEERSRLSQQLQQAQKLESVGRLAGGIAHDFNNLITVINGYGSLLLKELPEGDPLRDDVAQICDAGGRAAALTQQLLAFSRKRIVEPKPLRLSALVANCENMLRRLVGEDVELATILESALGLVVADENQIHQVLMNLVVNARDAMPKGGKLIIETANVGLDAASLGGLSGMTPGPYVRLMVTDTGIGMDDETRQRAFEPFFTTKEPGKGTGLGLSTVFGIVKQAGGHIWAHSEPGQGTTFEIYWPRIDRLEL